MASPVVCLCGLPVAVTCGCSTNDDSNAYVYGIDVANGDLVWPSILSLSNQFQGVSGAITYYKDSSGEYLFMGTTAGLLAMVDATTGLLVSSDYLSSGSTVFGAASIDPTSSTVFFTSQDMNVYAGTISGGSAMTAWSQLVISGNLIGTTPVIETSNNVLYVTTEGLQGGGAGGALCSVDSTSCRGLCLPTVWPAHCVACPLTYVCAVCVGVLLCVVCSVGQPHRDGVAHGGEPCVHLPCGCCPGPHSVRRLGGHRVLCQPCQQRHAPVADVSR